MCSLLENHSDLLLMFQPITTQNCNLTAELFCDWLKYCLKMRISAANVRVQNFSPWAVLQVNKWMRICVCTGNGYWFPPKRFTFKPQVKTCSILRCRAVGINFTHIVSMRAERASKSQPLYVNVTFFQAAPEKEEDGVGPNFASPLQAEKYEKASSPKWHQQSIPTREDS